MKPIVGYESSSDESDPDSDSQRASKLLSSPKPVASTGLTQKTTAQQGAPPKEIAEETPVDGPPLGPTLGPARGEFAGDFSGFEDTDTNDTEQILAPEPLSPYTAERSTLHALTQIPFMASSIPPSPPGSPNPAIDAKFVRFLELKAKGVHFNEDLARKSSFQNPSLLSNMLGRAGITEPEQYASTLPEDIWSINMFPGWAYKESLMQQQRDVNQKLGTDKKAQSAAGKRTIDFVGVGGSNVSSNLPTSSLSNQASGQQPGMPPKRKRP